MRQLVLINKIVIFRFDIQKTIKALEISSHNELCKKYTANDADKIAMFYRNNDYGIFMTTDEIIQEFGKNNEFFGIEISSKIVAGMWIHSGRVDIKAPSFQALKDKYRSTVQFQNDTIYSSHNLVDKSFRNQHLYTNLLKSVLFLKKGSVDNYIFITGYNNKKMINSALKYNGQIIGVAYVFRLLKYIWLIKSHFFGEKYWKNI